jgi:FkbM family methyltransferase
VKQTHGWYVPDEDHHFHGYFQAVGEGEYQKRQRETTLSYVNKFRRALDIGAHVGFWSRPLSEVFSEVIAFEPSPEYQELLKLNAPKVKIIPVALGETNQRVSLQVPEGNTGAAFVVSGDDVEMKMLDDYEYSDVDLIKIDVEGYELGVLKGAQRTLMRNDAVVVVEQKPHAHFKDRWAQWDAVKWLCDEFGYRIVARVVDDWILKRQWRAE